MLALPMDYQVVFDVSRNPPDLYLPITGLVSVATSFLYWKSRNDHALWRVFGRSPPSTLFAGVILGFNLLWTAGVCVIMTSRYFQLKGALRSNRAEVVEGPVEHFHPMPDAGRDKERFSVQGVPFAYSDGAHTGAFNRSRAKGGPIEEGLQVRIHYLHLDNENLILRLETRP
ncbi:hypothetical protein ACMHYB_55575 [Sorangium sp. So ce1128]